MSSWFQWPMAAYRVRMAVLLLLYAAALVVSLRWLHAGVPAPWKYAVAVMPVLPALGLPWVAVRWCQSVDELQLRIRLEGLAFGFAAAAIATLTYGFLQNAGLPDVSWLWVWPVMAVCCIVGQLIARRRYW